VLEEIDKPVVGSLIKEFLVRAYIMGIIITNGIIVMLPTFQVPLAILENDFWFQDV
jgi:hypothetical protein